MSLILVTAANRPYMDRIAPYLHTIAAYGGAFDRRVLVTVGCQVEMPAELSGTGFASAIEATPLPAAQAQGHTGNSCIQQGCFLEVLGAADNDVIVFTDGDVRMQRGLSDAEQAWMRAIPPGTIALGWNGGPHDTLMDEATRISLDETGQAPFRGWLHRKVYNVGVIICRVATYRTLYSSYLAHWSTFAPHTPHYAANQFLMCAVVAQLGMCVWELPLSVHTHGCFGLPAGVAEDAAGDFWVDTARALFRHHWKC